jgi:gamma-glutamyl phosphate reductase
MSSRPEVPSQVQAALEEVYGYASDIGDWIVVKKELLKAIPSNLRTLFSLRDPVSKRQRTNDFERELMRRWRDLGGRELLLMA